MPIIFGILLLLGVGTTAVADTSVPGDALYPIKIHVVENMESAFALTAKADANVDATHALRRLQEAETLASKGKLNTDNKAEVQTLLAQDVGNMNQHIDALNKKGDTKSATEVSARFNGEFNSHEKILAQLAKESTSTDAFLQAVLTLKNNKSDGEDRGGDSKNISTGVVGTLRVRGGGENGEGGGSAKIGKEDGEGGEGEGDDSEEGDDDRGGVQVQTQVSVPPATPTPTPAPTPNTTVATFTMAQVAQHKTSASCYTAISGSVYDLTTWINQHPGGQSAILGLCGVDGTSAFMAQHGGQGNPAQELASFKIGIIK